MPGSNNYKFNGRVIARVVSMFDSGSQEMLKGSFELIRVLEMLFHDGANGRLGRKEIPWRGMSLVVGELKMTLRLLVAERDRIKSRGSLTDEATSRNVVFSTAVNNTANLLELLEQSIKALERRSGIELELPVQGVQLLLTYCKDILGELVEEGKPSATADELATAEDELDEEDEETQQTGEFEADLNSFRHSS